MAKEQCQRSGSHSRQKSSHRCRDPSLNESCERSQSRSHSLERSSHKLIDPSPKEQCERSRSRSRSLQRNSYKRRDISPWKQSGRSRSPSQNSMSSEISTSSSRRNSILSRLSFMSSPERNIYDDHTKHLNLQHDNQSVQSNF